MSEFFANWNPLSVAAGCALWLFLGGLAALILFALAIKVTQWADRQT